MKLKHAGFREGVLWVRSGFRVFFRYPLAFTGLYMTCMFAALLAASVAPPFGFVCLLGALPLLGLGFMVGTERALNGRPPLPDVFIEPLKADPRQRKTLLKFCAVHAAAMVAAAVLGLVLINALSDEHVDRWAEGFMRQVPGASTGTQDASPPAPTAPRQADPAASVAGLSALPPPMPATLLLPIGILAMLSLVFWHVPALIHWGRLPLAKALFFSAVAAWRNFGAFVGYGLAWAFLSASFSFVTQVLFGLFGQPHLLPFAVVPAALMFSTVFYTSLYFTFVDSFSPPSEAEEERPDEPASPPT
jgi:hypothetical protein